MLLPCSHPFTGCALQLGENPAVVLATAAQTGRLPLLVPGAPLDNFPFSVATGMVSASTNVSGLFIWYSSACSNSHPCLISFLFLEVLPISPRSYPSPLQVFLIAASSLPSHLASVQLSL